jgi:hypothetical protein
VVLRFAVPATIVARRQDPSVFERWIWHESFPDLSVAARLMGNPFGGIRPCFILNRSLPTDTHTLPV